MSSANRRPLPPVEGADVPDPTARDVVPGGLPLDDDAAPPAGVVLNDTIGEPATTEAEPEAPAPAEGEAAAAAETDTGKKTRPKRGAAKTEAPARAGTVRGSTTRKAPARRQGAAQKRTDAPAAEAAEGGNGSEAEATPTASAPPPRAYAPRGEVVAFTPPPAALVPKGLLNGARALGLQWVAVNMRALTVRAAYDQACDDVRMLAASKGIPAEAVEAALVDMGTAIGAPVAAPVDAEASAAADA